MTKKILLPMLGLLVFCSLIIVGFNLVTRPASRQQMQYKTSMGECPTKIVGEITLNLIKEFEHKYSLYDVKRRMIEEKVTDRFFVANYEVDYNPFSHVMTFRFDCPRPLMKVQVYKGQSNESYNAILVDNGHLYDPSYEVVLRNEHKLEKELPTLALPIDDIDNKVQFELASLVKNLKITLKDKLSEMIITDHDSLTVILSVNGRPASVFLGNDDWAAKFDKLDRIINYLELQNKIPKVVNLTNAKKVVVKFSEQI